LLTGLGAFAGLQLTLALAYLAWPLPLREPDFAARLACLRRRAAARPKPCTVVFLGSSRVHMGVRAGEMEAPLGQALGRQVVAFNLGTGGCGPQRSLLNWHRLRLKGVRPDLLVVEVLPGLLVDAYNDLCEAACPTAAVCWDDLGVLERYGGPERATARRDWLLGLACPWHSQRRDLVSRAWPALLAPALRRHRLPTANRSADLPLGREAESPDRRARALEGARLEYADRLRDLSHWGRGRRALAALLRSCRREGVPVALLVTPEGPAFRAMYPRGSWPALRRRLRALAARYGAALIDARERVPSEDDFLDSHHLTLPAAQRFSRRLAREELLPLLGRPRAPGAGGPAAVALERSAD
jgi:hypothetical protein